MMDAAVELPFPPWMKQLCRVKTLSHATEGWISKQNLGYPSKDLAMSCTAIVLLLEQPEQFLASLSCPYVMATRQPPVAMQSEPVRERGSHILV